MVLVCFQQTLQASGSPLGTGCGEPARRQGLGALRTGPPAPQINQQFFLQGRDIAALEVARWIVMISGDQRAGQGNAEGLKDRPQQGGATAVHSHHQNQWRVAHGCGVSL